MAKKKKKKAAPSTLTNLRKVCLKVIFDACGRHAVTKTDYDFWQSIYTLKRCTSLFDLMYEFRSIMQRHYANAYRSHLVASDKGNKPYHVQFCGYCGQRWREHNNAGVCKGLKSVAPEDIDAMLAKYGG